MVLSLLLKLSFVLVFFVAVASPALSKTTAGTHPVSGQTSVPLSVNAQNLISESYGKLPLAFEPNQGQTDARVKYLCHGAGYGLFLFPTGVHLILWHKKELPNSSRVRSRKKYTFSADVIHLELHGANPSPQMEVSDSLPGTSNYFIGNDSAQWRTKIPQYTKLKATGVYPGIDLLYYGNQSRLEHDFMVSPGTDPRIIQWEIYGAQLSLNTDGGLVLSAGQGQAVLDPPICYQKIEGQKVLVTAKYVLLDDKRVGFQLGDYRKDMPLVIDPVLVYSTYLGGSGGGDQGTGIAVDSSGDAYVLGYTSANNFQITAGAYQTAVAGNYDFFISKLNPAGNALLYSTFLGGNSGDYSTGIAIDSAGDAYVTGQVASTNFPMVNAYQTTPGDITVTKINPTGTGLIFSTYLGSTAGGAGNAIAVDTSGNAYVAGWTMDAAFPTLNPAQAVMGGTMDAIVAEFSSTGSLMYSTFLGGSSDEQAYGIAVDGSGAAYVTGLTDSTNFPTVNPFQAAPAAGASESVFVTKVSPGGGSFAYSTYLGGNNAGGQYQEGEAIAVDSTGAAYVTGQTNAANFPVLNAFQSTYGGGIDDAFITKFNPAGNTLAFSTYVGGNGQDIGFGIALDSADDIYLTAQTISTNMPMVNPIQSTLPGTWSIFVAEFNPAASALIYSTYIGGSSGDEPFGIAVDPTGAAYVTGSNSSTNYPTVNPLQAAYSGSPWDAFVLKIANTPLNTATPGNTSTSTATNTPTATPVGATPTNTLVPTATAVAVDTSTFTPTVSTPTSTPTTAAYTATPSGGCLMWDNFDSAPWTNPIPSNLVTDINSSTTQTLSINNNTLQTYAGSPGSLQDIVSFTSGGFNEADLSVYNGGSNGNPVNVQIGGDNPANLSFEIYSSQPVSIADVEIYDALPHAVTMNQVIPAGVWTNVVVNLNSITFDATKMLYVGLGLSSPPSVVTFPYTSTVLLDNIEFCGMGNTPGPTIPVSTTPTVTPTGTLTPATNTFTPTNTVVNTSTFTPLPTSTTGGAGTLTSTPGTSCYDFDDFDEVPWTNPIPGYLTEFYNQSATQTTTIDNNVAQTYGGSVGSLEDAINFTGSGNLAEMYVENGVNYGASVNTQIGGVNPTTFSFEINPSQTITLANFYVWDGSAHKVVMNQTIPANTWTDVVVNLSALAFNGVAVQSVIFDMTSPASVTTFPYAVNVLMDNFNFCGTAVSTPANTTTSTFTNTQTPTLTSGTSTPTSTGTLTITVSGTVGTSTATPTGTLPTSTWTPSPTITGGTSTNTPTFTLTGGPFTTSTLTSTPSSTATGGTATPIPTSTFTPGGSTSTPTPTPAATTGACVLTSASLSWASDDAGEIFINGNLANTCGNGCWTGFNNITIPIGWINPVGDNVLAAYSLAVDTVFSGTTWLLTLNYANGTSTYVSPGSCVLDQYLFDPNAAAAALPPAASFPANWNLVGYNDTSWAPPGIVAALPPVAAADETIPYPPGGGVPWTWGAANWITVAVGDGYMYREHFQTCVTSCAATTSTPTLTRTATTTYTPTNSSTITVTPTGTWNTSTPMLSPTSTFTSTGTYSPTLSPTITLTPTGTWNTSTITSTPTSTLTNTTTNTATPTGTSVSFSTPTLTYSPTLTPTGTVMTSTPTFTPTSTLTNTLTSTATISNTPTNTPTGVWYTSTPTNSPTMTPTGTWYTSTFTPTITPTSVGNSFWISKNVFHYGNSVEIKVSTQDYPGYYSLTIYNSAGENIKNLDSKYISGPYIQSYSWDGTNKFSSKCASGVYVIYLSTPFHSHRARVVLIH